MQPANLGFEGGRACDGVNEFGVVLGLDAHQLVACHRQLHARSNNTAHSCTRLPACANHLHGLLETSTYMV